MAVNGLSNRIPFGIVFCVQQSASLSLKQSGVFRIRQMCPRDWLPVPAKDQLYSLRKIIIMILLCISNSVGIFGLHHCFLYFTENNAFSHLYTLLFPFHGKRKAAFTDEPGHKEKDRNCYNQNQYSQLSLHD